MSCLCPKPQIVVVINKVVKILYKDNCKAIKFNYPLFPFSIPQNNRNTLKKKSIILSSPTFLNTVLEFIDSRI